MNPTRALTISGGIALALTVAACGSSAPSGKSGGQQHGVGQSPNVLTVKTLRVGNLSVLADRNGMALYTPAQESSGKILCTATNGCTSFWKPFTVATNAPSLPSGVGKLGVIKLGDGTLQLTDNSRPLYTFVQDSPGQLNGNGFKDAFGGQHFTWHAILSSGSPARPVTPGSSSSGTSNSKSGSYPTY
jgi:predicted lipoprotein with Yx(FWY)xxD motif